MPLTQDIELNIPSDPPEISGSTSGDDVLLEDGTMRLLEDGSELLLG